MVRHFFNTIIAVLLFAGAVRAEESALPASYGLIPEEQREPLFAELFGEEDIFFYSDSFGETLISYSEAGSPQVVAKVRLLGTAESGILIIAGFKYTIPLTLTKVYTFEKGDSLPKLAVYKRGKEKYLSQFENVESSGSMKVDGITGATKICEPLTKEIKAVVAKALTESRSGNYSLGLRHAGKVWQRKPQPVLPAAAPQEEPQAEEQGEPQAEEIVAEATQEAAAAVEEAAEEIHAEAAEAVEETVEEVVEEAAEAVQSVDVSEIQNEITKLVQELSGEAREASREIAQAVAGMRGELDSAIQEAIDAQLKQQDEIAREVENEVEKRMQEALAAMVSEPVAEIAPAAEESETDVQDFGSGEAAFDYGSSFEDSLYESSKVIGGVEIGLLVAGVGVVAFSAARRGKGK